MVRWALSRSGGGGGRAATPVRGGGAVRRTTAGALDALHPLITLGRGLARLVLLAGRWWARTPGDRRGPALLLAAVACAAVAMVPYGPQCASLALLATALRLGRRPGPGRRTEPGKEESARLQALYEALVPFFALPSAHAAGAAGAQGTAGAGPLYAHGGTWQQAFAEPEFGPGGRVERLRLRYPAHFPDGDPARRFAVERLLSAKSGRDREYRFRWDEEHNHLTLSALEPLPPGVPAQRFVTGQGEIVLGFTDADAVHRTVPVAVPRAAPVLDKTLPVTERRRRAKRVGNEGSGGERGAERPGGGEHDGIRDVPPVLWRTGPRATEPHLLVVGAPGSGTSTLLRCVALQALVGGDVLLLDGGGSGEFAALEGREGVLAVETSLAGALASVEWAAAETERRLLAANRARQAGLAVPDDARRPLWLLLDRPATLSHLARAEGLRDPQELLEVPLRHGRAAHVTVAVAEHFEGVQGLARPVRAYTRARVALGAAAEEEMRAALGVATLPPPAADTAPGRGFARLGAGPVLRLRVPATPDPYDESAGDAERRAVLGLLPAPAGAEAHAPAGSPPVPGLPPEPRGGSPACAPSSAHARPRSPAHTPAQAPPRAQTGAQTGAHDLTRGLPQETARETTRETAQDTVQAT